MMRIMTYVSLCFFLPPFVACGQSPTQPTGSICGTVLDENGTPAASVRVVAIYVGAHSGMYPMGQTDKLGHYCVANVMYGDYVMSADDPEKGYPRMGSIFYGSSSPKEVSITYQNLQGHADWQIPYKAGFIKVHLTDARTGKQIIPMFFNLALLSKPDLGYMRGSCASTMPLLVPPNQDIYFTVSAPGYKEWPGDGTKGERFQVRSEVTADYAIALEPINP